MPYVHYDRLSAQDASMIDFETSGVHFHIGAVCIFDAKPLSREDGGIDFDRVRDLVESKLHRIPRFRQRVRHIPLTGDPVWVDDAHFNLLYHVRHAALPRPGTERQLKRLAGRIMSQPLDHHRPLWEFWVVEGLEGDRFAVVPKIHHCMVDGTEGVQLFMSSFIGPSPDSTVDEVPRWLPRPEPRGADLLRGELRRRASQAVELIGRAGDFARDPARHLESLRDATSGVFEALAEGLKPRSPTALNAPVGPHRRFDWLRISLDEVKEAKAPFGGTINDVVLATTTGALRDFLRQRGERVEELRIRAAVPVNVRRADEKGAGGNRVSVASVWLPMDVPDPAERLRRIVEQTRRAKRSNQVRGMEAITELSEWAPVNLFSLMLSAGTPYNIAVTNVPGPPFACYLLGAQMLETYPVVPLAQDIGLIIALFSYDGGLFWGFHADWDAVPDLHDFVEAVAAEFGRVRKAAVGEPARRS